MSAICWSIAGLQRDTFTDKNEPAYAGKIPYAPLLDSSRGTESRQQTTFLDQGSLVEPILKVEHGSEMVFMLLLKELLNDW